MRYDLATLARRVRNPRRKSITVRDIVPPAVLAGDLYTACYRPVVVLWSRAGDRIAAEYERTLSALTTDTADDLRSILDEAAAEFQRLFLLLGPALDRWAWSVESWQRGRFRGAVLSATGVDIQTLIGPESVRDTVGGFIEWNTALIKEVSAQTSQKISNAVFTGLTQRRTAAEVAKDIREATGFARDRSRRVASDQLAKITGSLAEERQREAGITTVEWRWSGKLHPRAWHKARNGVIYDLETHTPVDGGEPVERGDWAGQPPWCGCRTLAVISWD